jgi:translation initiation factor 4E
MAGNGAFNYREIKLVKKSTRCGCTRFVLRFCFGVFTDIRQMLAAIGETFDPALSEAAKNGDTEHPQSIITGVIVSARPTFYRLSIWTRLTASPNSIPEPSPDMLPSERGEPLLKRIEAIGKHFKTFVLGFSENAHLAGPMSTDVEFISHKDSERKPKAGKKWAI